MFVFRRIWHAFSWNVPFEICTFALLPTIWFIMILYYKMQEISLQYAAAILSQNTTKVYYKISQVFYYKMRQFYYNLHRFFQNETVIANCNFYHKIYRYKGLEKLSLKWFIFLKLNIKQDIRIVIYHH